MNRMTLFGLILILLGAAIALVGCVTEKPREVIKYRDPPVQMRNAAIGDFKDRNDNGQMSIPDVAPDGSQTLFKWTAIESADGHVFYGPRYLHPKEYTTPVKQ